MKSLTLTAVALTLLSNLSFSSAASTGGAAARAARAALEARQELTCPTCNPTAGLNQCDITTSCITIPGTTDSYCACRAGYKAFNYITPGMTATQFRLQSGSDFVNRVYVATGTPCDTLCDNPYGDPNDPVNGMCSEIPLLDCGGCTC